jgi:hypothetical protein
MASTFHCSSRPSQQSPSVRGKRDRTSSRVGSPNSLLGTIMRLLTYQYVHQRKQVLARAPFSCKFAVPCSHLTSAMPHVLAAHIRKEAHLYGEKCPLLFAACKGKSPKTSRRQHLADQHSRLAHRDTIRTRPSSLVHLLVSNYKASMVLVVTCPCNLDPEPCLYS